MVTKWIGVNQSPNLDETLEVARKYLLDDAEVKIIKRDFGITTREHYQIEYEVYVLMEW